ncbi:MAG: endonuclease, partial [Bacilli bacterium]
MKLHLKFTKNVQHSMFVFLFTSLTFSLLSSVNYRQPIHLEAAIPSSGINATNLTDIEVNAYYQQANVDGLTGEALKSALHNLIDDHSTVSYDGLKTAMKITDRDWASSPLTSAELSTYTHNDDPNLDVFYSNSTIKSSNIGSSENTWNREHTWAK